MKHHRMSHRISRALPAVACWRRWPLPRGLRVALASAGLLWLAGSASAADDAGIPGNFLRFGASARSVALGNAVVGLADDAATSFLNPAGLAQLRTMELTGMGATLFEDTRYGFFALGLPTENWGTFALSGSITSSGEFERTTVFEDSGETFSEKEGNFCLSYARGGGRFAWGLSLKHVSQDIGGASGSGSGADAGVYFRPHRNLSLGLAYQNLAAPKITLDEDEEKLATTVSGGMALRFFNNRLLVTSDLVKTEYMDSKIRSGMEIWPFRQMGFRAGYDAVREQVSAGVGFRYENWQFDYAFVDADLGSTNVLSATMRFGVPYGVKVHRDRALFSPSGVDRQVTFDIETAVRGQVDAWKLSILDVEGDLVRQLSGNGAPPEGISWGGEDEQDRLVADGTYQVRAVILDDVGQEWDYETSVQVMGFMDRTRIPIRVEINGGSEPSTEGQK